MQLLASTAAAVGVSILEASSQDIISWVPHHNLFADSRNHLDCCLPKGAANSGDNKDILIGPIACCILFIQLQL